eukprot:COSAG01_NODE_425_length_17240_cov_29.899306_25_plen_53_part_00
MMRHGGAVSGAGGGGGQTAMQTLGASLGHNSKSTSPTVVFSTTLPFVGGSVL